MIKLKIDILQALADKGFTRYQIRKLNVLSQSTVQGLLDYQRLQTMTPEEIAADPRLSQYRTKKTLTPTLETLNTVCILLGLSINDVVEIIPTDDEILEAYRLTEAAKDKENTGRRIY